MGSSHTVHTLFRKLLLGVLGGRLNVGLGSESVLDGKGLVGLGLLSLNGVHHLPLDDGGVKGPLEELSLGV